MKNSRKEFIKEMHKNAHIEWRLKIEKEFPKLFKDDKKPLNNWYKSKVHKKMMIYPNDIDRDNLYGYGINQSGYWAETNKNDSNFCLCNDMAKKDLIPATEQEVFEALKKEAVKRGVWNVYINDALDGVSRDKNISLLESFSTGDNILYSSFGRVFFNGKWATPIETITKEKAEKQLGKTIID